MSGLEADLRRQVEEKTVEIERLKQRVEEGQAIALRLSKAEVLAQQASSNDHRK